jgi:uncharacterized phiE125 gp8 family phage protein
MTIRVVTAPSTEPLSLVEAKLHCNIESDFTDDDALVSALIRTATEQAENYTRRAFVQRTHELLLPAFPACQVIEIPSPPIQSISYVRYLDLDGTPQTVSAADYQLDAYREPALLKPAYLTVWPISTRSDFNAVQIGYVCGYAGIGSPASDLDYTAAVPESVKQWLRIRVATLYAQREALVAGTIITKVDRDFVNALLDPFVVSVF